MSSKKEAPLVAEIISFLDELLPAHGYVDASLNGLQVGTDLSRRASVIVGAVDSGASVIEAAIGLKADLLIAHHGIFWGSAAPIVGRLGVKIERLLSAGLALYASHLPLDGHLDIGNGAQLGKALGLQNIAPWCEYPKGSRTIGVTGRFSAPRSYDEVANELAAVTSFRGLALPFGRPLVSHVAIVTGSGGFALESASFAGVDLFITGEPKHQMYHDAKELRMNVLFGGHYGTETFGVKAVLEEIRQRFDATLHFIDEPSGI